MVARLTQQIVEILGKDTTFAKARVTQQIVEVLGKDTTLAKTIFTAQNVEVLGTNSSVARAIFTAQNVEVLGTNQPDPFVQTLTITDSATYTNTTHNQSCTDPVTIADVLALNTVLNISLSDTLSFSDLGAGTTAAIHVENVSDTLTLSSGSGLQFLGIRILSDTLSFSHSNSVEKSFPLSDIIFPITDLATFSVIRNVTLSDTLSLVQTTVEARAYSLSDTVSVSQTVTESVLRITSSTISLSDSATAVKILSLPVNLTDTLLLVDRLNTVYPFSLSDTLIFTESNQAGFKTNTATCILTTYNPTIDPGPVILNGNPVTPPSSFLPAVKSGLCSPILNPNVVFTYPYGAPTHTLTLPAPEFNNHDSYEISRVTRVTRGNSLKIFRDPNWLKTRILDYSFTYLTEPQKQNLLSFLLVSLGGQIGLLDFENKQWVGFIINPQEAVSQTGRYLNSATIKFQEM